MQVQLILCLYEWVKCPRGLDSHLKCTENTLFRFAGHHMLNTDIMYSHYRGQYDFRPPEQNGKGRKEQLDSIQIRTGTLIQSLFSCMRCFQSVHSRQLQSQHVAHTVKIKPSFEDTEERSSTLFEQQDRAGCPAVASSNILGYGKSNIAKQDLSRLTSWPNRHNGTKTGNESNLTFYW